MFLYILLFLFQSPNQSDTLINISKFSHYKSFSEMPEVNKDIILEITFSINEKAVAILSQSKNLERIKDVRLSGSRFIKKGYKNFVTLFSNQNITHISMRQLDVTEDMTFIELAPKLVSLEIYNSRNMSDLIEEIELKHYPNLTKLVINSYSLPEFSINWKSVFKNWTSTDKFYRLEYLDLSHNRIDFNDFNIINFDKASNIKTLKLNEVLIETYKFYDIPNAPYKINSIFRRSDQYLDYTKAFFANLTHFEIKHSTDEEKDLANIYSYPFFKNLENFSGPVLSKDIKDIEMKSILFEINYKSKTLPISITHPENISYLLKSKSIENYEEITFSGKEIDIYILNYITPSFKNIKQMNLFGLNISEKDLSTFIKRNKEIQFNIAFLAEDNINYWPRIIGRHDEFRY